MLKLLFTGGGLAGFVLALFLGVGFDPIASAHSGHTASAAPAHPADKAGLTADKILTQAAASLSDAQPAQVQSQITDAIQSIMPGAADTTSSNQIPSIDSLGDTLNQLTGPLLGGNGKSDFNSNDLMKLLGGR